MSKVNVTKEIKISAQSAWENISSFRGIENISPIARSVVEGNGVGATRSCFMPDDAEIKEELTVCDNDNMLLEYVILSGPFPITDYVSQVKVTSTGENSCTVSWQSTYQTADENTEAMKGLFEGFYNVIIDSLEELLSIKA